MMHSNAVVDETQCGSLCQHPSCWYSERRLVRQTPHTVVKNERRPPAKDEDVYSGLPTQTVVNMLEDYGEDPNDQYPSKYRGKPAHSRGIQSSRAGLGESFRTPNATPASPLRSTGQVHSATSQILKDAKPLKQIEVQEVFDLDDLRSDWHQTFQAKKYYVWVPNHKKKKEKSPAQLQKVTQQPTDHPHSVRIKDLTAQLVPEEIEQQREAAVVKRPRKQPTSFWKSIPYYYPDCHCETPRPKFPQPSGKYDGVYELLDLPKDVLGQIMQHITEKELLDRHKFAEALIRILPQLEKNNTAISMAYSDVLRQYPVILNNKKAGDLTDRSEYSKPVFVMDDHIPVDIISESENLATGRPNVSEQTTPRGSITSDLLSQKITKKPLPSILLGKGMPTNAPPSSAREPLGQLNMKDPTKKRVPNISLGLPDIPSGIRATKSFTYQRNEEKNFTLAPVITPSPSASSKGCSSKGGSVCSDVPAVSTVHVTVPTVISDRDDFKTPSQTNRIRQEHGEMFGSESEKALAADLTLTRDSTITTKIPRVPVNTPNIMMPEPRSLTPDMSSNLDAIQEHKADISSGPLPVGEPMSRDTASRSVRFSVKNADAAAWALYDEEDERNMPPDPVKQLSFISNAPSVERQTAVSGTTGGELVVIGQGAQPQPTPPSHQRSKHLMGGPAIWPYVETETPKAPSPVPSSQTGAASLNTADVGGDQSTAATYDCASEQSGITHMMPRSGAPSRESSAHSEQVKRMWHEGRLPQSPAPPPPSPEPTRNILPDLVSAGMYLPMPPATPATARENAQLAILKEVTETDSEITITAPPPSNLDDFSRINTPNSISSAPRGLTSRENTGVTGVPRVDTVPELSESKSTMNEPWSVHQEDEGPESVDKEKGFTEESQAGPGLETEIEESQAGPGPETEIEANHESNVRVNRLEIPSSSGGEPPQIDMDQLSAVSGNMDENPAGITEGRLDYLQSADPDPEMNNDVEEQNQQEGANEELANIMEVAQTNSAEQSEGGVPPQIDEDQFDDTEFTTNAEVPGSACKPLQPALNHNRQANENAEGENKDLLDTFDVTEENLKDELKEELKKFKE